MAITETITEAPQSVRTYKHSADIENFYRFVYENNLRREAHLSLSTIHSAMTKKKKGRRKKSAKAKKNLH